MLGRIQGRGGTMDIEGWLSFIEIHSCLVQRSAVYYLLEWIVISFSRGCSQPRDRTLVSCTAGRFFTV